MPNKIPADAIKAPPVYFETSQGRWKGLDVEIWQMVARQMDLPFEFLEFNGPGSMLEALEKGKMEVVPSLWVY